MNTLLSTFTLCGYDTQICKEQTKSNSIAKEKGRDLTQSYDKSPYTSRNVKRAKQQHIKQRHKKVRLYSGCGPT